MNILKRELKSNRKSFLIWIIVIISLCVLSFTEGSAFIGETAINDMMENFPDELVKMFSMDSFDIGTAEGFYGLMVSYISLALAIYCVMRGNTIIISEERDKTVEFSLVLPIKRKQLLTAKLRVVFIYGIALNIIALICSMIFGLSISAGNNFYKFVLVSSLAVLFIQTLYITLGFCIGCVFKNHKRAGSAALSILLTTYFFSIFSAMHEKLEFLKYLSPFKFFDFVEILEEMKLDIVYVIITLALSAVFTAIGYISYQKRDMHI